MLDDSLKTQLKSYLERVTQPFEISASLNDSDSAQQMLALLQDVSAMSDKITLKTDGQDARRPSFSLQRTGTAQSLRFAAIPLGHEFTSRVLALLQVGGHPPKVEAGRVGVEASEHRQFAVGQHDLDRQYVGARDPVQQTMGSTGVGAHVAADRTGLLARRVGRVVKAMRIGGLRKIQVEHTRFDPRDPVVGVDLEDPVHFRGRQDDRTPKRNRSTGEARTRTPRSDGPTMF